MTENQQETIFQSINASDERNPSLCSSLRTPRCLRPRPPACPLSGDAAILTLNRTQGAPLLPFPLLSLSDSPEQGCSRARKTTRLALLNPPWCLAHVIESFCVNCEKQGKTRLLLTNIPMFREVIISSFYCDECGYKNNEVQFAGQIKDKGIKISLVCQNLDVSSGRLSLFLPLFHSLAISPQPAGPAHSLRFHRSSVSQTENNQMKTLGFQKRLHLLSVRTDLDS